MELRFGEGTPYNQTVWQPQSPRSEFLTPELATLAGVLMACLVAPTVCFRLTSVDLMASELKATVGPDDLVVVAPWYPGITFGRYYKGPAPWINLPNVDFMDHHLAYKEQKTNWMPLPSPLAIQDELEQIEKVLRSGGKIWWIGPLMLLRPGESPLMLSGAPDPQYGWSETAYMKSWQQVTIAHMQSLGVTVDERTPQRPYKVNPNEDPPLFLIEPLPPR